MSRCSQPIPCSAFNNDGSIYAYAVCFWVLLFSKTFTMNNFCSSHSSSCGSVSLCHLENHYLDTYSSSTIAFFLPALTQNAPFLVSLLPSNSWICWCLIVAEVYDFLLVLHANLLQFQFGYPILCIGLLWLEQGCRKS